MLKIAKISERRLKLTKSFGPLWFECSKIKYENISCVEDFYSYFYLSFPASSWRYYECVACKMNTNKFDFGSILSILPSSSMQGFIHHLPWCIKVSLLVDAYGVMMLLRSFGRGVTQAIQWSARPRVGALYDCIGLEGVLHRFKSKAAIEICTPVHQ